MLRTLSTTTAGLLALTGAAFAQTETGSGAGGCTSSVMIERGDTFGKIAQRCDVSLAALMQANPGLEPRRLKIGEQVTLPGGGGDSSAVASDGSASGQTYTIRAGDTLFAIARERDITLAALRDANPGVNPRRLRIGQTLTMPGAVAAGSAASGYDEGSAANGAGAGTMGYGAGTGGTSGAGAGATSGYGSGSSTGAAGAASAANAQPGQAMIAVFPTRGAAGSRIVIQGNNFSPGETVEISFARAGAAPTAIGQVKASERGDFSAQTTAPANAAEGLQLVFSARSAGGQTVETQPFTIGAADGAPSAPDTPQPQQ